MGARPRLAKAVDAAHRPCKARWWFEPGSKTVLIDSSRVIGLAMLPPRRFHPFELDTFGLGMLLSRATGRDTKRCLVGIGGSATNDGGAGLGQALGFRLLDTHGRELGPGGGELDRLDRIEPTLLD